MQNEDREGFISSDCTRRRRAQGNINYTHWKEGLLSEIGIYANYAQKCYKIKVGWILKTLSNAFNISKAY